MESVFDKNECAIDATKIDQNNKKKIIRVNT